MGGINVGRWLLAGLLGGWIYREPETAGAPI